MGFEVIVASTMNEVKSEIEIFNERIKNDLVAIGEFDAMDLINNSVSKDNFLHIESTVASENNNNSNNKS